VQVSAEGALGTRAPHLPHYFMLFIMQEGKYGFRSENLDFISSSIRSKLPCLLLTLLLVSSSMLMLMLLPAPPRPALDVFNRRTSASPLRGAGPHSEVHSLDALGGASAGSLCARI